MKTKMKTKEIKEELNKEIEQAMPEADLEPFKSEKIVLADDSSLIAHKKLDKFKYLTAVIILAVMLIALAIILPPIIFRNNENNGTSSSSNASKVTCYIFETWSQIHIITENDVVLAIEGLNADGVYMVESLQEEDFDISNLEALLFKIVERSCDLGDLDKNKELIIRLYAINNDMEEAEKDVNLASDLLKQKLKDNNYKLIVSADEIDFEEYNVRLDSKEIITDLDAQKDVILSMEKAVDDDPNNNG